MSGSWGALWPWEFQVLDWLQGLRGPWLDQVMIFVTSLANHGELWIPATIPFRQATPWCPLRGRSVYGAMTDYGEGPPLF